MRLYILILFVIFVTGCKTESKYKGDESFKMKRKNMVETQIKARGVKDKRVLDALLKVERDKFVTQQFKSESYEDYPLPIGEGQTISQPYIVGLMTELAEIKKTARNN